jgi:hypothetical protein
MKNLYDINQFVKIQSARTGVSTGQSRPRNHQVRSTVSTGRDLGTLLRFLALALTALALGLFDSGLAEAADKPQSYLPPVAALSPLAGWEIRAGGYAHNPFLNRESRSADLNIEVLTPRLADVANREQAFLIPRINAGTTIAFARRNTTLGYAGFAWTIEPYERVFIEGSVGLAFHDGFTGNVRRIDNRAELGCNPLIHSSGTLGYRLTDNWSVMLTLQHISNGGLCSRNQGLTHIGGRIGYSF